MSNTQNNFAIATLEDFVEHGLVSCSPESPTPDDTVCSVCTENCLSEEDIVKIVICSNCYFHKDCLMAWLTSTNTNRGTCPNDRTQLFTVTTAFSSSDAGDEGHDMTPFLREWVAIQSQDYLAAAYTDLADFVSRQSAASSASEIVNAWHADAALSENNRMGHRWISTTINLLRCRSVSPPLHDLSSALEAAALDLETEVASLRNLYNAAARTVLEERSTSLRRRMDVVRRNSGINYTHVEASLDDYSSMINTGNTGGMSFKLVLELSANLEEHVTSLEQEYPRPSSRPSRSMLGRCARCASVHR